MSKFGEWLPIESAPAGQICLFCDKDSQELRHCFFVDWMVSGKFFGENRHRKATHWMPLPGFPKE